MNRMKYLMLVILLLALAILISACDTDEDTVGNATISIGDDASISSADSTAMVTVYITKTGEKYHRAGCKYLSKSCIPISKSDAIKQGYTPCSVCKP